MSSVFTKLFEMLILPDEEGLPLSPNQYGFRNKQSVGHGITLCGGYTDIPRDLRVIYEQKFVKMAFHQELVGKILSSSYNV